MRRLSFFIIVLLLFIIPGQAQGNSLSVTPTSGPPGTVVTLNLTTSEPVRECYVNGAFIGDGSAPYTVPGGAQGTLVFRCDVGLGGEFMVSTNEATFTVTAPPPPPPDTATITISINPTSGIPPINVTLSAQTTGSVQITQCTANGAPFNLPNYVVPESAQGNIVFRCEGMGAAGATVTSNDAVFTVVPSAQPTVPPTAPPTQIPLPAFPNDGVCYVATTSPAEVNIRAEPNTTSAIVGALNPAQIYVAVAQSFQPDGIWFRLEVGGYVAGFVTRQTQACEDIVLEGLDIIDDDSDEGGMVQLAIFSYDFESLFEACPELLVYLDDIPLHILNFWADYFEDDPYPGEDPCDWMWEYIESTIFADFTSVIREIPPEVFDQLVRECPGKAVAWLEVLYTAWYTDDEVFNAVLRRLPADICAATDDFLETIRGFGDDDYSAWLNRIALPIMVNRYCGLDVDESDLRAFGVLSLFDYDVLVRDAFRLCDYVSMLVLIGSLSDAERDFYERYREACAATNDYLEHPSVAIEMFYIIRSQGINVRNVPIDTTNPRLCTDPWAYLYDNAPDPLVDGRSADVPPQLADCPEEARMLRARNDTLDPYILLAILNARNPCEAAASYLYAGIAPTYVGPALTCDPNYTGVSVRVRTPERRSAPRERDGLTCAAAVFFPLPNLIDNCARGTPQNHLLRDPSEPGEGVVVRTAPGAVEVSPRDRGGSASNGRRNQPDMTLVLADGSVIDKRSSWEEKVAALSRNPNQICEIPPPRLTSPPIASERICYGVTFALRDDSRLSGRGFGPTVGLAVVTNFTDGRPSVLETNYQLVNVRPGGSANLSFVAYVTDRNPDPNAVYGVDVTGLPDLSLVNSTGIRHGQVSDELCRNNTTPRDDDFLLLADRGFSFAFGLPFVILIEPDAEPDETTDDMGIILPDDDADETESAEIVADEPDEIDAPPLPPSMPGLLPGSSPGDPDSPGGLPPGVEPISMDDIPAPDVTLPLIAQPGRAPIFSAPTNDAPDFDLSETLLRLNPLFNGRIDGTSAVFQGEFGGRSDLYMLRDGEIVPVFEDESVTRLLPAFNQTGGLIAFIEATSDGDDVLRLYNRYSGESRLIFAGNGGLRLLPYRAAWMPNAADSLLFISLENANGERGIYLIDLSEDEPVPAPFIDNAYQPVMALDGMFMAYVRDSDGVSNVITRGLRSNREQAITNQAPGTDCHSPTFSNIPTTMYFLCGLDGEERLYRYNLAGLEQIELPATTILRPAAGPVDGFISYDDGERIYLSAFDGSLNAPLIELDDLIVTGIHWAITP